LWGQSIKLAQVASASELLENQQNDLVFFKIIPSHFCRASEASKIDCFKNMKDIFFILYDPKKFQFSNFNLQQKILLFQRLKKNASNFFGC
jgi:hypothetical protein